jgi:hypothetical protein
VGRIVSTLLLIGLVLLTQELTQQLGWGGAVVTYSLLIGAMTGLAGLLLRSTTSDSITWRNRLAGWMLPGSAWVGGGTLSMLIFKNGCLSLLLGWATILLTVLGGDATFKSPVATAETAQSIGWQYSVAGLTFICWLMLGIGWLQLCQNWIGQRLGQPEGGSRHWQSTWLMIGAPLLLLASVTLRQFGLAGWALTLVLVPLLVILFPVTVMSAVLLYHWLIGKPIRWN